MIKLMPHTLLVAFSVMMFQTKAQEAKTNSFSLQQSIDYAYKNSPNYLNAENDLNVQQQTIELAQKIYNTALIKYREGVGSSLEVTDAESALREAQINYYNALYDALVSRIDLVKAYGKINSITTTFQK